jgi:hypothetical protein
MWFSIFVFMTLALAAPAPGLPDCGALKSLALLKGAQIFCAAKYPAASAPVQVTYKTNAKRYKADDERVWRVLDRMPESRQKAFCACYPAVAVMSSVSVGSCR